jgi:septal ring factor EnvC (AmiA/AmiB activator)
VTSIRTTLFSPALGLLLVVAMFAVPVLGVVGSADAQTPEQRQLADARDRLARLSDEIDAAEADAEDAEHALEDADATLREVEQVVNEVALSVEAQRVVVADTTARLHEVELEAAELEAAFNDRVARLFKDGPANGIELLLNSGPAEEAIARGTYLQQVAATDQISLERLEAAQTAVAAERRRVAAEQERLEEMLAEQEALLAEVQELRERRALAAASARDRVRDLDREHGDLEEESDRLEAVIRQQQEEERRRQAEERRRLEEERRREAERQRQAEQQRQASQQTQQAAQPASSSGSAGGGGGSYVWPICAPVTSEYGPRWGTIHRGIDLGASTGTPIGASAAGRVIFAGWQGGYGNLVVIDHGNGVATAYAHMSSIAAGVGANVSQRQVIGYVGSTGDSTGPHLHLEFRVNGTAVNPRQYLSGGC